MNFKLGVQVVQSVSLFHLLRTGISVTCYTPCKLSPIHVLVILLLQQVQTYCFQFKMSVSLCFQKQFSQFSNKLVLVTETEMLSQTAFRFSLIGGSSY